MSAIALRASSTVAASWPGNPRDAAPGISPREQFCPVHDQTGSVPVPFRTRRQTAPGLFPSRAARRPPLAAEL